MEVLPLLQISISSKDGLERRMPLRELTDDIRELARKKYDTGYSQAILSPAFDADVWKLNNQVRTIILDFDYRRNEVIECVNGDPDIIVEQFIEDLKTIIALRIGTCDGVALRSAIRYSINCFIESEGYKKAVELPNPSSLSMVAYLVEFLMVLPYVSPEFLSEAKKKLAEVRFKMADFKRGVKPACTLNEFKSYFKLDDALDIFLDEYENTTLGQYFMPFIIFWKVTTILPMRVTEFCVTPYNCIRQDKDLYYLTIRRSRLKGSSSLSPKIHYYTINKDYDEYEYEIPKWLYDMIHKFQLATKNYAHPYGLLLSCEYTINCNIGHIKATAEKVFGTDQMGILIKDFYSMFLVKKMGMTLVDEKTLENRYLDITDGSYEMFDDEIMMLKAKHTRHLAMINLIMRGCNPMMIREFAGHADEVTSAHYYGNVSKTVRCATKILYDKVKNRRRGNIDAGSVTEINPLSLLVDTSNTYIEVDHGKCYSPAFLEGNLHDCGNVDGNCDVCRYFIANKENTDIQDNEAFVDKELEYLMKLLKSENLEKKMLEFQMKTQQLESDMANLSAQYWKELMRGEKDGKKEKVQYG